MLVTPVDRFLCHRQSLAVLPLAAAGELGKQFSLGK